MLAAFGTMLVGGHFLFVAIVAIVVWRVATYYAWTEHPSAALVEGDATRVDVDASTERPSFAARINSVLHVPAVALQRLGETLGSVFVQSGALEIVSAGGIASGTTVSSGGILELMSGAQLSGVTTLNFSGIVEIGSGYTASAFVVSNGGILEVASSGVANGTVVSNGSYQYILAGGTASGTVLSSGGGEIVSADSY